MALRITQFGEPILRETGAPVQDFDARLKELAAAMLETMYDADGIGLAAQQVGIALQICVVDLRPPEGVQIQFDYSLDGKTLPLDFIMPLVLVNPQVEITDPALEVYDEGCLSFPAINGRVTRPAAVRCSFQDLDGEARIIEANGLLGRCILHEVDHLNGKLFIDRMDKNDLHKNATRIKQIKRASRDFLKKK
ncbi:MAG: Peptide deformylase [Opitutia bacterium UBA7350]|nr:MAG: Peptide deformylase [Opitutae bacterium UBA7350]